MNTLKSLTHLLLFSWIAGNIACTKNTLDLPEPARSIEGTYEAQNNITPSPTKGQVVRLTIKRVTADSVKVVINTAVGGQLADSLTYERVLVGQEFGGSTPGQMCVGYRIRLVAQPKIDELRMTCREEGVFEYLSQGLATVKFKKI